MPEKEVFEYAIIRYVPRVEREEFLNIGVIVFSKRFQFLGVKYEINKQKILSFYPESDLQQLTAYLKSWELISNGDLSGGKIAGFDMPYRFRWLTAARSTIIQSSKPHPGLCDAPNDVLTDLFDKYVK